MFNFIVFFPITVGIAKLRLTLLWLNLLVVRFDFLSKVIRCKVYELKITKIIPEFGDTIY